MEDEKLDKLRYPIGRFKDPETVTREDLKKWIAEIEILPSLFRKLAESFTEEMLEEKYKPGGWTARQVIHHVADSHLNAYIRFKLTLTEALPVVRPYLEDRWAELFDGKFAAPELSLSLLENIHLRWLLMLKSMSPEDFDLRYYHPQYKKEVPLKAALALYAWHGRHHLGHLLLIKNKETLTEK